MILSQEQISQVQQAVRKYIDIANLKYNRQFTAPVIRFDLRGKSAAGMYLVKENVIRVHAVICAQNFEHYIKQTIGHEVAHLVVEQMYKDVFPNIKPHGVEWQRAMKAFGLPADRCAKYDASEIKSARRTIKYQFSCNCKVHEVGPKINTNIASGRTYSCRDCKGVLKPGTLIGGSKLKSQVTAARRPLPRVTFESTLHQLLGIKAR